MQQLSAIDAQFLGVESTRTFSHVGVLAVYDPSTAPGGNVTRADMCRLIGERLHLLPPFRWRLVTVPMSLDLPYWIEDPDFDLDYHVRETAVPPPGDERTVAETLSRIHSRPLDRNHPLWELYVIHGLRDGRVGMYTKVHHAAADGVSGNEILTILLDHEPDPPPVEPGPGTRRPAGEEAPGALRMFAKGMAGMARHPVRVTRVLPRASTLTAVPGANAFPGVPQLARALARVESLGSDGADHDVLEASTARAPRTSFNGPLSPHRRIAIGTISLDRVKAVKSAAGTTVNDVLVALCAGALRSWLAERNDLPADPLTAMIPVSVRTAQESGAFGNRISSMVVPIPTDEPDPVNRLRRAHEVLRGAKERHKALPATLLTDAGTFVPPAVLSLAARATVDVLSRTRPPVNLVISNVPGPREPLYCAGARLEHSYPISVVLDGVGMNITVMSYRDGIDIGVVADREQVDECDSVVAGIAAGLDQLETAVDPR